MAGIGPFSIISAKGCALGIIEPRGLSGRFAVKQAVRATGVELHYPVANNLKPDAADLRRFRARGTIINRRQSQKPSRLRRILPVFLAKPRGSRHLASKSTRKGSGIDMANLLRSPC